MLRSQLSTQHHAPTAERRHRRRNDRMVKPAFLAFLEDFDPNRFKRDASYRLRTDRSLLAFSEAEATAFCRIYLKLLTQ